MKMQVPGRRRHRRRRSRSAPPPAAPAARPVGRGRTEAASASAASAGGVHLRHAMAPFGPACASVPVVRGGQLHRHGHRPGRHRRVEQPGAVHPGHRRQEAGLVDTLNSAPGITVFAPGQRGVRQDPGGDPEEGAGRQGRADQDPDLPRGPGHVHPGAARHWRPDQDPGGLNGDRRPRWAAPTRSTPPTWSAATCRPSNATVYIIGNVLMPPTS